MKRVFAGEILHILPLPNGIIIAYIAEKNETRANVNYKMINFDEGTVMNITTSIYRLSKFGSNYQSFQMQVLNYVTCRAVLLSNGKVFVMDANGSAKLLDDGARTEWVGSLLYRGEAPADLVQYGAALWASFPESGVLVRYSLHTMREELRIGGGRASTFSRPEGLWVDGDKLMVCNAGSHKLWQVDLKSYAVTDYEQFEEPVHQYVKIGDYELVVLDSGVYLL